MELLKYDISYDDCINFIEKELGVTLFDYQKLIIKCFIEGKRVRVPRGGGRTMLAKAFAKYVANNHQPTSRRRGNDANDKSFEQYIVELLDKNDYLAKYFNLPEIVISWRTVVSTGVLSMDFINSMRNEMTEKEFDLFFCEYATDDIQLANISTQDLVAELQKREGVDTQYVPANEVASFYVNGAATILAVLDPKQQEG